MRRLSHTEYARTIQALFPGISLTLPELVPDRAIGGFDNNVEAQAPSALLTEEYVSAARTIAATAVQSPTFLPCQPTSPDQYDACARQFLQSFGARAFRRPLTNDELTRYADFLNAQANELNFTVAVRLTIEAMLLAPQFLYRLELPAPDAATHGQCADISQYELASRLSYFLWGSMPDDILFSAAAKGELSSVEQIAAQTRRMLADPLARDSVVNFHRQWLDLARLDTADKDPATYPEFNEELRAAMRAETERFAEHVVFEGDGRLSTLLTSSDTFVNAPLARLYGVPPPDGEAWTSVTLDSGQRAGVLTQASFLAGHGHAINPSPVLRGVFVLDRLLCAPPGPPAANVTVPTQDPALPAQTNRQRYATHATNPACAACHESIDDIGFTFEGFDSIGRLRTTDDGLPVDTSGAVARSDVNGPVSDAVGLARKLSQSAQVRKCAVTQWFRYALGRTETSDDAVELAVLDQAFVKADEKVLELIVAITTSEAFRSRRITASGGH